MRASDKIGLGFLGFRPVPGMEQKIKKIVLAFPEKYSSVSHFVRVAVTKLLMAEGDKYNVGKKEGLHNG